MVDRLHRFYRERKVQPYAPYPAAQAGGAEMDEARDRLAAMMGVARDEVSFGPSTSANTYVLAQAVRQLAGGHRRRDRGDQPGPRGEFGRLAAAGRRRDRGARMADRPGRPGIWTPPTWHALLADGKVRLVCFPHCSNVVAEINPVAAICAMARAAGARTVVDGVSYAPHGLPDVPALGCDVYLFSAYKTYGPHQGIMVIRRAFGDELPAQGHFFNAGTLYKRFTPAGPDHAQIAACAGMADYIDALHARHFAPEADPAARNRAVHDLMRAQEVTVIAAAAGLSRGAQRPAADRARALPPTGRPTVAVALDRAAEPVSEALGRARHHLLGRRFLCRAAAGGDGHRSRQGCAADEPGPLHQRRGGDPPDRGAGRVL